MKAADSMALIMDAHNKIFASKLQGIPITAYSITTNIGTFRGRWFKNGETGQMDLRGFDVSVFDTDKNGRLNLRFLEQNPNKKDAAGNLKPQALLASQGHRIMWVLDRTVANGFLGRIEDGIFIPSTQNPVQNVTARPAAVAAYEVNMDAVPEINEPIPEAVVRAMESGQNLEREELLEFAMRDEGLSDEEIAELEKDYDDEIPDDVY